MTNQDKQGNREDSWPGRENGPELCGKTWDWGCWETPGNTERLWGCLKPPRGSSPSPSGLVFARVGAGLGAGMIPLPSQSERCPAELRLSVWRCPPGHPVVTPRQQETPAGQDKATEVDALPLHWQLPPCTQGCSAGTWDLPGHLLAPPPSPGRPPPCLAVPTHGGGRS